MPGLGDSEEQFASYIRALLEEEERAIAKGDLVHQAEIDVELRRVGHTRARKRKLKIGE